MALAGAVFPRLQTDLNKAVPEPSLQSPRNSSSTGDRRIRTVSDPLGLSTPATASSERSPEGDSEDDAVLEPSQVSEPEWDVDALDPSKIEFLLSSLEQPATEAHRSLRLRLLERWATIAPGEAAVWSRMHLNGDDHSEAVTVVATRWFESDPAAAIAFAKSVEEPATRATALLTLGYEALRNNARESLELVQEVPPSSARNDFLAQAVQEWAGTDFEAVRFWVEQFTEQDLKDRLRSAVATGRAEVDGGAAASYAATAMQPGEDQDRAVVSVLQRWVQSQPEDAVAWLEQFPESHLKRVATQNLIPVWLHQDPQAATHWLDALPPGSLRSWAQAAKAGTAGTLP